MKHEKRKEALKFEFTEKITALGKISNQLVGMREYLRLTEWIALIFDEAYEEGIKDGVEKWSSNLSKN